MPIFTDLQKQGRASTTKSGLDAVNWFREKALAASSVSPSRIINTNNEYTTSRIIPGHLYLFGYDPKYKDTLPYYDRYPLVFPFSSQGNTFTGLNLHYLPPFYRARLMDALYNLVSDQKFNERTRLNLSYDILSSSARYKYFEPCVKKYLVSHVQTKFLQIPSNEWDIALFLPLERFTENKNTVYKQQVDKIRRV